MATLAIFDRECLMEVALTFSAVVVLACIHLFAGRARFLDTEPHSPWLSAAAGCSIAYVMLHILPKLAREMLGLRMTLLGGHDEGQTYTMMVVEYGLLSAGAAYSWEAWKSTVPHWFTDGLALPKLKLLGRLRKLFGPNEGI